ncbi:MAG TPA: hypothetical protein VGQ11_11155 [Candidatus Acidoferrales bacterium]|nr:hypothetical protein [Candidatus Acidoferrales bacterium]
MKRISFFRLGCSLLLVALGVSGSIMRGELSGVASDRAGSAVLWRDPGESRRDLYYGPGGRENVPDGKFTFVEEIAGGASPKFDVRDEDGTQWRVKLGDEVRSETAATRLLWAAGYFADENYYFAELRIEGMKPLRRGQEFVTGDGTIRGARMERRPKHRKQIGTWSWFENPFVGTRELNG